MKRVRQKAENDAKAAAKAHKEQHCAANVAQIVALEDKLAKYYEDIDLNLFSEYSLLMDCVGGSHVNTSVSN